MNRPRTKPQTGKRRRHSAGRSFCRDNPGDPSCYYAGNNNQFVNAITGQNIDSGCIGGNRNDARNPRDCDFRKVVYEGPNRTQLAVLAGAVSEFNRARIQYADSQALIKKYSPFSLNASGWPDIPGTDITQQICQNPTPADINKLTGKILQPLRNQGVEIWVNQRGAPRLKCVRGMPALRYPPGMAGRNRYFQMGISYAGSASAHLFMAFGSVMLNNLRNFIEDDERAAVDYVAPPHGLVWDPTNPTNRSPIRQWRRALKLLKPRSKKGEAAVAAPALVAQIEEAAAAAAAQVALPPVDQDILDLAAALDNENWDDFAALLDEQ